jgi:RsiW-degrading membrane proteinase PrsW (M82 family)
MSYTPPPGLADNVRQQSDKLFSDLRALRSHLLLPVEEIRSMRWIEDRRLISILLLGLFPIAALNLFRDSDQATYWCFGFYFSVLWALFFFRFFSPIGATRANAVLCFLGTGVLSMAILMTVLGMGLESLRDPWIGSSNTLVSTVSSIFFIGVPEEFCKALVILYLLRTARSIVSLPTMVFYGLMSGLGFGIYEGMNYQMGQNFNEVGEASTVNAGVAHYYFDNMLRLTTLPFLHAMWTGIGAYFWSLGYMYRSRRNGLYAAALGIPATLHGLYDGFINPLPWFALLIGVISVMALMIYLSRSQEFEKVLREEAGIDTRGITHTR